MQKLKKILGYIFANFGPLIIFYGVNYFFSLQLAILFSVLWTVVEIAIRKVQRKPIGRFFIYTAGVTIIFGAIDLYMKQSVFFRYESALTNFITGLFFATTIFDTKSMLQELAENSGRLKVDMTPERLQYFRVLTGMWVMYFWLKAAVYVWVATHYTLEEGMIVRLIVGNITLYTMIGISMFGTKYLKRIFTMLGFLSVVKVTAVSPSSQN